MTSAAVKSARISRGSYQADAARPVVVRSLADPRQEELAGEVARLKGELADLQQEHRRELERRCCEKYERGLSQGREEGAAGNRARADEAVELLGRLTAEIKRSVDEVWERSHDQMAALALTIARKVVGVVARQYQPLAVELTRRCLTMVREQSRVTVVVNPDDAATIKAARGDLLSLAEGVRNVEVVERASVPRGGVVVETDSGQIDARLEEQLSAVESALLPGWSPPAEESPAKGNSAPENGS